jgi:hypothetical protein
MIADQAYKEKYRYSDWAVTTPLMLFVILRANRFPLQLIAAAVAADLTMIYFGYRAVRERNNERKLMFFWTSCLAFLPILYLLFKCNYTKNAKFLTLGVWLLYPILWYLNEKHVCSNTFTVSMYAIMDVLAKVGLVYFLQE